MLGLYPEQCQGVGLAFCEIKEIVGSVLEPERRDLGRVSMAHFCAGTYSSKDVSCEPYYFS